MPVELDELAGPFGREEGRRLAQFWKKQLEKVRDDSRRRRWVKRGETIEKRYRDERNRVDEEGQRHYNALWSNVEILFPALYGRCPVPVAERKFKDRDPTGRSAAQILERSLRNEIEICGFDEAMQQAVRDYLLPGMGAVWVRYEPEIEEGVSVVNEGDTDIRDDQGDIEEELPEDSEEELEIDKLQDTGDKLVRESTPIDYVYWDDFFTFPHNARVWKEVTAVGKRVFMTRDRMLKRFGRTVGKDIPLGRDARGSTKYDAANMDPEDKGEIFEIWSLVDKTVYWVAEGYDYLCDRKDDPLGLENFFPCPRPLYSNRTNGTLIPVPDYLEYQDQAIQIDELTQRISMLAKACKVAGVYNAAAKEIQRVLNESVENELIPVDDWAAFAEQGGVAGNISLLPLKEIIGVLNELMMIKAKAIEEMDRLTGITDIMRGTTDARETLGGQRLKTNSSGTRLQHRQNEVARFARDVVRIMADIQCQHFSNSSIIEASGALYEEGLGDIDPSLMEMHQLGQQGSVPPTPQPALPPPMPPQGQAAMPGAAPPPFGAAPPLSNVVPFPSAGAPQPPAGGPVPPLPAGGPPMAPGMPPRPPGGLPMAPGMPPMRSGLPVPVPPPMPPELQAKMLGLKRIMDGLELLRNERLRGFRVDIEVDSTIYGDSQQERGERTQFITAITQYLQQSMAMGAQVPEIVPLLGKFLQFGVRGFKVGRDLESAIEDFCDGAVVLAKQKLQQASQQPNPQMIAAQAQMVKAKATAQAAQGKDQRDQAKAALDARASQAKLASDQTQAQAEIARQHLENQGEQANAAADMSMKQMDMRMREMELQLEQMRLNFQANKMSRESAAQWKQLAEGGEG